MGGGRGCDEAADEKKEEEVKWETYEWRVGQSHDSGCHFSDEYDEDDGEELQEGKKRRRGESL